MSSTEETSRKMTESPASSKEVYSELVSTILESMPPTWREVLQEHWKCKSIEEIAKDRNLKPEMVRNVVYQASGRFKVLMDKAMSPPTVQVVNESARNEQPRGFFSWLFGRKKNPKPARNWRKAWEAWNLNSHPSQLLHDDPQSNHQVYSEIRYEAVSASGKRAVLVGTAWHAKSMAVHEFNKEGLPSRGPYYVKGDKWRFSKKRHIATVAKAKDGYSFDSSLPTQHGGGIPTRLIKITEFYTSKHEPLDYASFVALAENSPAKVGSPQPD